MLSSESMGKIDCANDTLHRGLTSANTPSCHDNSGLDCSDGKRPDGGHNGPLEWWSRMLHLCPFLFDMKAGGGWGHKYSKYNYTSIISNPCSGLMTSPL